MSFTPHGRAKLQRREQPQPDGTSHCSGLYTICDIYTATAAYCIYYFIQGVLFFSTRDFMVRKYFIEMFFLVHIIVRSHY